MWGSHSGWHWECSVMEIWHCTFVCKYQHFRGTWCHCLQGRPVMKMTAANFFKTLVSVYQNKWPYIPEDYDLGIYISFVLIQCNTGRFIMFSVITNIYNKKTKGPTLMELFIATGKQKKFFLTTRDVQCVHHGWHGTHRYDIQVLATHVSTWVHRYSCYIHSHRLAAGMWTTMKNNCLGKQFLSCSFCLYRFRKYVSYGFPNFF
jgi:hypothetical protein